MDLMANYWYFN